MDRHIAVWLGCATLLGGAVAGCGGGGGGGSAAGGEAGSFEGAKVIDVNSMKRAEGSVTYCQGQDTPGNATR